VSRDREISTPCARLGQQAGDAGTGEFDAASRDGYVGFGALADRCVDLLRIAPVGQLPRSRLTPLLQSLRPITQPL